MIKLSTVGSDPFYLNVEVDIASLTPPETLRGISFVYQENSAGDLNPDLLDTIIAYKLTPELEVIVEIPAELKISKEIISFTSDIDFSIMLLPPVKETKKSKKAYLKRLEEFTGSYLGLTNFSSMIYPITDYIHEMSVNLVSDNYKRDVNKYTQSQFYDVISKEFNLSLKKSLKRYIYRFLKSCNSDKNLKTGEECFKNLIYKIFNEIALTQKENIREQNSLFENQRDFE